MMNELQVAEKTMTSTQFAEMTGREKKHINQEIRRQFGEEIVGHIIRPTLRKNGQVADYHLPELESIMLCATLDKSYLRKISDFWKNRVDISQPQIPQTMSEALKLAYEQSLKIEKQQASLLKKDDLIIASNEASIKAGEILIREFVKSQDLINIGEKKFYTWLRGQEIIQANSREPYQYFVDRGYFTYKPTEDKHGGKFRYTLRVTPRGKVWLSVRFLNWQDKQDIGGEQ